MVCRVAVDTGDRGARLEPRLDGTDRARSPMEVQRDGLRQILANPETKRRIGRIHGWMAYREVVDQCDLQAP